MTQRALVLWRYAFGFAFAASAYLLLTPTPVGARIAPTDESGHLALFAVLAFTLARALDGRPAAAYAIAVAWGLATEALQLAIPGRSASWSDVAVDAFGALAAFIPYKARGAG